MLSRWPRLYSTATQPPATFSSLPLHPLLLHRLSDLDLAQPTLIQAQAIPLIAEGRNVLLVSETGSGKTLAYLLPVWSRLLRRLSIPDTCTTITQAAKHAEIYRADQLARQGASSKQRPHLPPFEYLRRNTSVLVFAPVVDLCAQIKQVSSAFFAEQPLSPQQQRSTGRPASKSPSPTTAATAAKQLSVPASLGSVVFGTSVMQFTAVDPLTHIVATTPKRFVENFGTMENALKSLPQLDTVVFDEVDALMSDENTPILLEQLRVWTKRSKRKAKAGAESADPRTIQQIFCGAVFAKNSASPLPENVARLAAKFVPDLQVVSTAAVRRLPSTMDHLLVLFGGMDAQHAQEQLALQGSAQNERGGAPARVFTRVSVPKAYVAEVERAFETALASQSAGTPQPEEPERTLAAGGKQQTQQQQQQKQQKQQLQQQQPNDRSTPLPPASEPGSTEPLTGTNLLLETQRFTLVATLIDDLLRGLDLRRDEPLLSLARVFAATNSASATAPSASQAASASSASSNNSSDVSDAQQRQASTATPSRSVLVFVNTKLKAIALHRFLEKLGFQCWLLSSDLDPEGRVAIVQKFAESPLKHSPQLKMLIATPLAGRGLDYGTGVTHVIHADAPGSLPMFIHQSGRTSRAGRHGEVITLLAPSDKKMIGTIERFLEGEQTVKAELLD